MSRVVVIGATGHIGSYLVLRLVAGGHEVIAMSRGMRGPYLPSPRWDSVTMISSVRWPGPPRRGPASTWLPRRR
jgi:nucleoside-diphosphate-sugar epimerase